MWIDVFIVIVVVIVYFIVALKIQYEMELVPLTVIPVCSNTVDCM